MHKAEAGGSAPRIETEGAKRLLHKLQQQGLDISSCVIDCNMAVAKVLRERGIDVEYDLHHVAKIVCSFVDVFLLPKLTWSY